MSAGAVVSSGRSLVWIDGAICDAADARVSVFDRGFLYGDSVYEVTRALFLLVGIAPLRSAKSARWMQKHLYGTIIPEEYVERLEGAADPAAEGERIAVELIEELAAIPGVAGVHIMAPVNDAAVPGVIAEARKRLPQRQAG